jgi:hypothetical protein
MRTLRDPFSKIENQRDEWKRRRAHQYKHRPDRAVPSQKPPKPLTRELTMPASKLPLIVPRINLNGTSPDSLIDGIVTIIRSIDAVHTAMNMAVPHGRDYQFTSDGRTTLVLAHEAWAQRWQALKDMKTEFENLALAIQAQKHEMERRS